ncbi:hypothetical protein PoB_001674200 [Plakobranchus ocellatus]|uniref:Uncharacterized protein n=1 Tax=Plakobranchus ocellatus TaxID=259542 RepID=A0AAV3Z6T5_9GAST|nr:hypothetical protein PoB_001674200 [Plakobranchus ocellatus]
MISSYISDDISASKMSCLAINVMSHKVHKDEKKSGRGQRCYRTGSGSGGGGDCYGWESISDDLRDTNSRWRIRPDICWDSSVVDSSPSAGVLA